MEEIKEAAINTAKAAASAGAGGGAAVFAVSSAGIAGLSGSGIMTGLAGLRRDLRTRLQASCVCDARRFARDLEAAYRWMWHEGCRRAACHDGGAAGRDTGVASERREPCPAGQA